MKLLTYFAAAVVGTSFAAVQPAKAGACYPSLITDDMNILVMEGKSVDAAWQEQVRIGNADGTDYCWRKTKSYIMSYKIIRMPLYNAVFR